VLALAILAAGAALGLLFGGPWPSQALRASPPLVQLELFHLLDTVPLLLSLVLLAAVPLLGRLPIPLPTLPRWPTLVGASLALGVAAVVAWGLVHLGHPLSVDEFLATFQRDAVLAGYLLAPIDPAWDPFAEALQPLWVRIDHARGLWVPGYRPVNAALLAIGQGVGAPWLLPAVLAAATPALGALAAQRALPDLDSAPLVAGVLLASSAQILFTAGTPYAMTAHLALNAAWLALVLRDDAASWWAATALGLLAVGVHQVHIHPALAAPFLLHLLWRRWMLAVPLLIVDAIAFVAWVAWRDLAVLGLPTPPEAPVTESAFFVDRVLGMLGAHSVLDVLLWPANLLQLLSWQVLAWLPLVLAGLLALRRAPVSVRLCAAATGALLLPYLLLMPGQGHGWGYRYLQPALAHLAVVAAYGAGCWSRSLGPAWPRWRRGLVAASVLGLVIVLPLRAVQIRAFVEPFARASAWIASQDEGVVIVDDSTVWFGLDLVRNDPLLRNEPKVLAGSALSDTALQDLCARYPVTLLDADQGQRLGLDTWPRRLAPPHTPPLAERLHHADCILTESPPP